MSNSIDPTEEIRKLAESNLYYFSALIHSDDKGKPLRMYGDVHKDVFKFLSKNNTDKNQLLLLPRGHQKSHALAVWAAWHITNNPETTILYISATAQLAEDQLFAIKSILGSAKYKKYWPEMINPEEGKREKWAATGISVDHPKRRLELVRDPTVRTAGLTTNIAGWHADVVVADDVVVPDNAYTVEGRRNCARAMSQITSIKNAGGIIKACGTRYHAADQYHLWKNMKEINFNDEGDVVGETPVWEIKEEVVETEGVFLWPRTTRKDGKSYGFNRKILERIKAEYTDTTQFYSQYYNDPNAVGNEAISSENFQYYDTTKVTYSNNKIYVNGKVLKTFCSVDFAYSLNKRADYTAVTTIGVAEDGDIYVLDIDRFKTTKIASYFDHILEAYSRWGFRKIRLEVTAAQKVIAEELKSLLRQEGVSISVDMYAPPTRGVSKEERINLILQPKYDNQQVWHFHGGITPLLEEELTLSKPPHDDMKDSLASAVDLAKIKPKRFYSSFDNEEEEMNIQFHSRWGGISL